MDTSPSTPTAMPPSTDNQSAPPQQTPNQSQEAGQPQPPAAPANPSVPAKHRISIGRILYILICLLITWPILLAAIHPSAPYPGETKAAMQGNELMAYVFVAVAASFALTKFSIIGMFVRFGAMFIGIGFSAAIGRDAPLYAVIIAFVVGVESLIVLPYALKYMVTHPQFVGQHYRAIARIHLVATALAVLLSFIATQIH